MQYKVFRIQFKGFYTRAYTLGDIHKKAPLIILHGGPGGCVERYEPLERLAEEGIPLIFYDQLGCGYSRLPKEANINPDFKLYLDELENVVKFFNLSKYHILGHSWGGMLVLEYICERAHLGLQKVILFSTLPSTKIWNEEHLEMIKDFPVEEKNALVAESKGLVYDKNKYVLGVKRFNKLHVGKKSTEIYNFKRKHFPKTNKIIYEKMWGKSELFGTGTLKNWSVVQKLGKIDVPTLIISGLFDESSPKMNELMNNRIKNSKWLLLKKSHHIGYVEETDLVINEIKKFI